MRNNTWLVAAGLAVVLPGCVETRLSNHVLWRLRRLSERLRIFNSGYYAQPTYYPQPTYYQPAGGDPDPLRAGPGRAARLRAACAIATMTASPIAMTATRTATAFPTASNGAASNRSP